MHPNQILTIMNISPRYCHYRIQLIRTHKQKSSTVGQLLENVCNLTVAICFDFVSLMKLLIVLLSPVKCLPVLQLKDASNIPHVYCKE